MTNENVRKIEVLIIEREGPNRRLDIPIWQRNIDIEYYDIAKLIAFLEKANFGKIQ